MWCRIQSFGALLAGTVVFFGPAAVSARSGFSGMQVQGMSVGIAQALGRENTGVLVRDVAADGPAARAGVERGDIILKFNGTLIKSFNKLIQMFGKTKPGQDIVLDLLRVGKPATIKLKLGLRPPTWKVTRSAAVSLTKIGLTIAALTSEIRTRFNLRWGSVGVLVTLIDPAFANRMQLKRGDLIVQVNQQPVWHPDQVTRSYRAAITKEKSRMLILVERNDGFQYMMLPVR